MGCDRVARVRSAYERFNCKDIDGLLALMTGDVAWPDIAEGEERHGRDALRRYLTDVLAFTTPLATLGDVFEVGDAVVALAYHEAYGDDGRLLGPPRPVSERFTFRGELIDRVELTSPDQVSDAVRARLPQGHTRGGPAT